MMWIKQTLSVLLIVLSFGGLHGQSNQDLSKGTIVDRIEAIKQEYAPDRRVTIFDIQVVEKDQVWIVQGETNLPDALASLKKTIGQGVHYDVSYLPQSELGERIYGVVSVSVCNIRSNAKHSAELATQAIMGTQIKIYKRENNWFYVQTPDGYLGWLDEGAFQPMSKAELQAWKLANKGIYLDDMGVVWEEPSLQSAQISDILIGNQFMIDGAQAGFSQIVLPDGRRGYIPTTSFEVVSDWQDDDSVERIEIIQMSKRLLGRPYLWGGTSAKAMDCSGFTKTVYFMNGYQLPRDASQQVHEGVEITTHIDLEGVLPGDLLFFGRRTPDRERVTHVAIYLGDDRIIHSGDGKVQIQSLNPYHPDFVSKRRDSFLRAKNMIDHLGKGGLKHVSKTGF